MALLGSCQRCLQASVLPDASRGCWGSRSLAATLDHSPVRPQGLAFATRYKLRHASWCCSCSDEAVHFWLAWQFSWPARCTSSTFACMGRHRALKIALLACSCQRRLQVVGLPDGGKDCWTWSMLATVQLAAEPQSIAGCWAEVHSWLLWRPKARWCNRCPNDTVGRHNQAARSRYPTMSVTLRAQHPVLAPCEAWLAFQLANLLCLKHSSLAALQPRSLQTAMPVQLPALSTGF